MTQPAARIHRETNQVRLTLHTLIWWVPLIFIPSSLLLLQNRRFGLCLYYLPIYFFVMDHHIFCNNLIVISCNLSIPLYISYGQTMAFNDIYHLQVQGPTSSPLRLSSSSSDDSTSMTPKMGNNVGSAFEVITPVVTMGSAFDKVGGRRLSPNSATFVPSDFDYCVPCPTKDMHQEHHLNHLTPRRGNRGGGDRRGSYNVTSSSSRSAKPKNKRYKMELCKNMLRYGKCKFGDDCDFIHDESERRSSDVVPVFPCLTWVKTGCWYVHEWYFVYMCLWCVLKI